MKTKRWLSLMLAAALLLSVTPCQALAAEERTEIKSGNCGDKVTWTLYDDGELVIGGTGNMTNYTALTTAPWYSSYRGQIQTITVEDGVTGIGEYAFRNCSILTSVDISDSVESIGRNAFEDCSALTAVTIGNGVTTIGNSAFSGCSALTSIDIPDSVTSIGGSAFENCYALADITIGSSVTTIGSSAFQACFPLIKIIIPKSVTTIGMKAFYNCYRLNGELTTGEPNPYGVYYSGTAEDWNAIEILDPNDNLKEAKRHYIPDDATGLIAISFAAGDGSDEVVNVYRFAETVPVVYRLPACGLTPPTGKRFSAWSINGSQYNPGDKITVTGNTTVMALWANCEHDAPATSSEELISAPTCGRAGAKNIRSLCSACGKILSTTKEVIPATGEHSYGATTTVTAPAGSQAGEGEKTCTVCGHKVTFPLYQVRYRAINCAHTMEDQILEGETQLALPECTFTPPDGMEFLCWSIENEQYDPGDEYEVSENTVVTPVWGVAVGEIPINTSSTPETVTLYTNQPVRYVIQKNRVPYKCKMWDETVGEDDPLWDAKFVEWRGEVTLDGSFVPTQPGTYTFKYEIAAYTTLTGVDGQEIRKPTGQYQKFTRTIIVKEPSAPISCDLQPDGSFQLQLKSDRFSESGVLLVATYAGNGRMLDGATIPLSDMTAGYSGKITPKIESDGTYKVFLLDGETYAPLITELKGSTGTSSIG